MFAASLTHGSMHLISEEQSNRRAITFRGLDNASGLPTLSMTRFPNHLSRFKPRAVVILAILVIGTVS